MSAFWHLIRASFFFFIIVAHLCGLQDELNGENNFLLFQEFQFRWHQ